MNNQKCFFLYLKIDNKKHNAVQALEAQGASTQNSKHRVCWKIDRLTRESVFIVPVFWGCKKCIYPRTNNVKFNYDLYNEFITVELFLLPEVIHGTLYLLT